MTVNIGTVEGTLTLKDQFNSVIDRSINNLNTGAAKLDQIGSRMSSIGGTLTTRVSLPLAAVGGVAIKSFGDFDQAMTNSLAIMGDVSDEMKNEMAQAARDAAVAVDGNAPSATAAAEAYFYLASAGLDAQQSLGVLDDVTRFAKAGNFDLALATDLLTDAQSALGLTVKDTAQNEENLVRVSDVLVKANTLANATVQQFSESLTNKAGTAMKLLNIDIEAGAAVLAAWADQGVKGQVAGERFDIVTRDLLKVHRDFKDQLDASGIAVFDASGNFRNMADIIEDVENATAGMTAEQVSAELATLGFQNRSISAIKSLIGLSDNIREYEANLRDAGGTTALVAENQMKSLWSRLELVKNQFVNLAMSIGESLLPVFDKLIPIAESVIAKFNSMSPSSRTLGIVFGVLAAAAGPVLIVLGSIIKSAGTIISVMPKAAAAVKTFTLSLTPLNVALGAVLAAVIAANNAITRWADRLSQATSEMINDTNRFSEGIDNIRRSTEAVINGGSLDAMSKALGDQTTKLRALNERQVELKKELDRLEGSRRKAIETGNDHGRMYDSLLKKLEDARLEYNENNREIGTLKQSTDDIKDAMRKWEPTIVDVSNAIGDAATSGSLTSNVDELADTIEDKLKGAMDGLLDMTNQQTALTLDFTGTLLGASDATDVFARAMNAGKLEGQDLTDMMIDLKVALAEGKISEEQFNEAMQAIVVGFDEARTRGQGFADFLDSGFGSAVQSFFRHARDIGNIIGDIFGPGAQRTFQQWTDVANEGFAAWASFAQGDILGTVVHGINAVKGAFDALFPSTKLVEERISEMLDKLESGEGTLQDFEKLTYDLWKTLMKVAEEGWDAARAADIMSESFSRFVDVARDMGDEGLIAIEKVVNAAIASGVGLEEVASKLREVYTEAYDILEERSQFLIDQSQSLIDNLLSMMEAAGTATRQEVELSAMGIIAAFNSMLEAGMPFSDILANLGDLFDMTAERGRELGLDLGAEFERLGEVMAILADERAQNLIARLEGAAGATEALGNMGLLAMDEYKGAIDALVGRITATNNRLLEMGLTGPEAVAAMRGPLQTLHDLMQQYGFSVDESTQELLDMALAQGVVADRGLSTEDILIKGFDRLLEGINRLILALGGVPVAFDNWSSSAESNFDDVTGRMGRLGDYGGNIAEGLDNNFSKSMGNIGDSMIDVGDIGQEVFDQMLTGGLTAAFGTYGSWEEANSAISQSLDGLARHGDDVWQRMANNAATRAQQAADAWRRAMENEGNVPGGSNRLGFTLPSSGGNSSLLQQPPTPAAPNVVVNTNNSDTVRAVSRVESEMRLLRGDLNSVMARLNTTR